MVFGTGIAPICGNLMRTLMINLCICGYPILRQQISSDSLAIWMASIFVSFGVRHG